jgi:hypothetical protein
VPEHELYEAQCALAAGGLLDDAEYMDFQTHMKLCDVCRANYQELSHLVTQELPQAEGSFRQKLAEWRAKPLPFSRQRFLRRARNEGVVFSREVETLPRSKPWYFRPIVALVPIAGLVAVLVSFAVYHLGGTQDTVRAKDAAAAQQVAELKRENSELTASLSKLNDSLAAQQREIRDLLAQQGKVAAAGNLPTNREQARGISERSSSQNVQLPGESERQEKLLNDAREEVARIDELRAGDEVYLGAQRVRIEELTDKLRVANATLDMERQLAAAGKDVRELMVARQLHVIDVRDTDPNGNPSKAFGRVFLTERKSLTFYAFDLNENRAVNPNRSFQVWAVPEGNKNLSSSLGFLTVDPEAQGRWVLKVDNPELLKQINSVFVTSEAEAGGKQPNGQKMLYAYLGEANHP